MWKDYCVTLVTVVGALWHQKMRKMGKCDNWTLWQLSQCHTFLSSNIRCVSKIPKPLCSIVSVSISLHPMVRKKSKNGHFIMEVLVFNTGTKNVENAIFQFSTWFLKSFPLTEMGPLYLKKNCKPSSTRIYHNLPSWPTHGRVIALAKCIQCGWTVGICTQLHLFALNWMYSYHNIEFCDSVQNLPKNVLPPAKMVCSTQLASSIFVTRMRTTKVALLSCKSC